MFKVEWDTPNYYFSLCPIGNDLLILRQRYSLSGIISICWIWKTDIRFDGDLCKIVSIYDDQNYHGHLKATDRYFYAA